MKINNLLTLVVVVFIASCSNDNDMFPSFSDDCNWETSLNDIISDNESLFGSRNFQIIGTRKIENLKVNEDLFYSGKYGFFPIYSETDSVYKIVDYDEICKNASKHNFKKEKTDSLIRSFIEKADDYDIVELTWKCNSDIFNSLALFNKRTGELEYDNMLFNMSSVSSYNAENFSLLLTQFEVECVKTASDVVNYYQGFDLAATAGVSWSVFGTWDHHTYMTEYLNEYHYTDYATFKLSFINISPISYVSPYFNGATFVRYANRSVALQPRYALDYAIWAGPQGVFNSSNFSFAETESYFLGRFNGNGEGKIRWYQEAINPRYSYWDVPKH